MITVSIRKEDQSIETIMITGHAGYAPKGADLVCAAVSALATGALNALEELATSDCRLEMTADRIVIEKVKDTHDSQLIINTLIIQLKTIQERYGDYIRIEQTEV